jgi:Chromo shadow domain
VVSNKFYRGASEVLDNYFEKIGGRPESTSKLGKRKSTSNLKTTSSPPLPKKVKRTNGNDEDSMDETRQKTGTWMPKKENWESEIASIDTVERDRETGKLWAFIFFTNNRRSKVGMEMVYKHCPLAMLKFYERHLSVPSLPPEISCDSLVSSPKLCCRIDLQRLFGIETDQILRRIGNSMPDEEFPEAK